MNGTRRTIGPAVVDILSKETVLERIAGHIEQRGPCQVVTLNALMFNHAQKDASYASLLSRAALVIPDSVGIIWGVKLLTGVLPERIPGIDLVHSLCRVSEDRGYRIFLLGAAPGVAEDAARFLEKKYPRLLVAGAKDGYFTAQNEPAVIAEIASARPDILMVGLSLPRQELWIDAHLTALRVPVVIGVGGSFDVLSGRLRRSPRWMQHCGMEWLFRLLQQPWRFFRIASLSIYILQVLRLKYSSENG